MDRFVESRKLITPTLDRKGVYLLAHFGCSTDSPLQISESLLDAFASVFNAEVPHYPAPAQVYSCNIAEAIIRQADVVQIL